MHKHKALIPIIAALSLIFIAAGLTVFLLRGRDSDITESPQREIQILFGGGMSRYINNPTFTFFRVVDGNVLETYHIGPLVSADSIEYGKSIEDSSDFDISMLDKFITDSGQSVVFTFPERERSFSSSRRVLSQRQLNNIWILAANVEHNDSAEWYFSSFDRGRRQVWIIIDGEMFRSSYVPNVLGNESDVNIELLRLLYYFIDLSPQGVRDA